MTLAKTITKTLDIDVEDVKIDLTATIKSYDLTDTKFIFDIHSSNGLTVDLTGSTAMYIVEYVHNSQTYAIQGDITVVNSTKISFNLPEDLKGYKGTVLIGLYVKLTDGTKIDIKDIAVRIEPSIMDKGIDFTAKTYFEDFESVKAEVVLEGKKAKTNINAVVSDVNGYAESQKQIIHNTVTDVQSTGNKAKNDINAVLPSVQAKVSAINTELAKIDENMPDLYVAYADDINGSGFSKTDTTKLYKGYGVKNSNIATDYRWERNADNLQVGGRNLIKNTSKEIKNISRDAWWFVASNGYTVDFNLLEHLGKTLTFRVWIENPTDVCWMQIWVKDKLLKTGKSIQAGQSGYSQFTIDVPKDGITNWNLVIGNDKTGTQLSYGYKNLKCEVGNIPTDWSPAPEDQVSQVELDELKSYIGYTDSDIYGVEIDMTNRRFKRLSGAIGKNGGADFDNINAYKRRRCILTNDGVVLAYHGESNYTENGATTAQIVKNGTTYPIGTPVQVMVEQPKFYYKVVPLVLEPIANGKGYHMRKGRYYISDYPKSGFKVHPAFVRNGVEHEKIYLSAYEGSIYDKSANSYLLNDEQVADFSADLLSSIANAKPCSGLTQNLARANVRLLAHNRGNGWEQQTIQTASLTQLLFLIEYAKFNMQDVLGMGATQKRDDGTSNLAENTGSTTTLGNASGAVTNSNSIQIVSYRGEENPYGNIWKFVDGINVMAKGIHAVYVADHDFNDKQSTGSYTDVGFTLAKTTGFVSAFGYSQDYDWLFLTSETTGNSSVPVGDYFWQNYAATDDGGWRTVLLGASWNGGSYAGGFGWSVDLPSVLRHRTLSGRLVYLGG